MDRVAQCVAVPVDRGATGEDDVAFILLTRAPAAFIAAGAPTTSATSR
jgi:hypothetical protein